MKKIDLKIISARHIFENIDSIIISRPDELDEHLYYNNLFVLPPLGFSPRTLKNGLCSIYINSVNPSYYNKFNSDTRILEYAHSSNPKDMEYFQNNTKKLDKINVIIYAGKDNYKMKTGTLINKLTESTNPEIPGDYIKIRI
tara:strand:+ start:117 stop:542 length:426 start_codon:yes stop_codon:yes gene_type:complete